MFNTPKWILKARRSFLLIRKPGARQLADANDPAYEIEWKSFSTAVHAVQRPAGNSILLARARSARVWI